MKKRTIGLILVTCVAGVLLTACGNMSLGLGNYLFEKVHVDTHHYSGCFTIVEWFDGGSGIEVLTEEAGSMFLSEGSYVLLEGAEDCPFCGYNEIRECPEE